MPATRRIALPSNRDQSDEHCCHSQQGLALRRLATLATETGTGAEHADCPGGLLWLHLLDLHPLLHQLQLHAQLQVGGPGAIRAADGKRPLVGSEQEPAGVRGAVHRHQPGDRRTAGGPARPAHSPRRLYPHHLPVPHGAVDDRHRYRLEVAAQSGPGPGQDAS
ncbi:hypothetical protein D3C81_1753540 [compost metagenome]